jgi:hypothetical protein
MSRFQPIRKTEVPQALRGPWRSTPAVKLDPKGQLYFTRLAAHVFTERRLAVVEFDQHSRILRFTAVDAPPADMLEDDLFRLTWGSNGRNGCSLALKSLLHFIGFRLNGHTQELAITAIDDAQHSISVLLPAGQMD